MATFLPPETVVSDSRYLADLATKYSDRSAAIVADDYRKLSTTRVQGRSSVLETRITTTNFVPKPTPALKAHTYPLTVFTTGRTPLNYGLVKRISENGEYAIKSESGILARIGRMIHKHQPQAIRPQSWSSDQYAVLELANSTLSVIEGRNVPRKRCRLEADLFQPSMVILDPALEFDGQEALLIARREVSQNLQIARNIAPIYPRKKSLFPRVDKFDKMNRKRLNNGELVIGQPLRKNWLRRFDSEMQAEEEDVQDFLRKRLIHIDPETLLQIQFPHEDHEISAISEHTEEPSVMAQYEYQKYYASDSPRKHAIPKKRISPSPTHSSHAISPSSTDIKATSHPVTPQRLSSSSISFLVQPTSDASISSPGFLNLDMSFSDTSSPFLFRSQKSLGAASSDRHKTRWTSGATPRLDCRKRSTHMPELMGSDAKCANFRRHSLCIPEFSTSAAVKENRRHTFMANVSFSVMEERSMMENSDEIKKTRPSDATHFSPKAIHTGKSYSLEKDLTNSTFTGSTLATENPELDLSCKEDQSQIPIVAISIREPSINPETNQSLEASPKDPSSRNSNSFIPINKELSYPSLGMNIPPTTVSDQSPIQASAKPPLKSSKMRASQTIHQSSQSPRIPLGSRSPNSPGSTIANVSQTKTAKREEDDSDMSVLAGGRSAAIQNESSSPSTTQRRVLRSSSSRNDNGSHQELSNPSATEERMKSLRKRKAPETEPESNIEVSRSLRRSSRLPTPAMSLSKSRRSAKKKTVADKVAEALEAETKANTKLNKQGSVSVTDKIKWLSRRIEVGDISPLKERPDTSGKGVTWPNEEQLATIQEFSSDNEPSATTASDSKTNKTWTANINSRPSKGEKKTKSNEASARSITRKKKKQTAALITEGEVDLDSDDELALPGPNNSQLRSSVRLKRTVSSTRASGIADIVAKGTRKSDISVVTSETAKSSIATAPVKRTGAKKGPKKATPASLSTAPKRRGRYVTS